MNDSNTVKRIAILNPYLQGGHTQTAEIESTARFTTAAARMGIQVEMFAQSEHIESYNPDFIISNTYQEPKLTRFPTYGILPMPLKWVAPVPRFVRNVLSYDGFLIPTQNVMAWTRELCASVGKPVHIAEATFSYPKTPFEPCDFSKALAVYLGTNWDGSRHRELFLGLSSGEYLKCFGRESSWNMYPPTLYGGPVPFDGVSPTLLYRKHAVGLCISHPDFDEEGIPSNRTFEIAAASALPICSKNEFSVNAFGDSLLYFDAHAAADVAIKQVIEQVKWVRQHPEEAQAMAKKAHDICNSRFSLETYIQNIVDMHHEVMEERCFTCKTTYSFANSSHVPEKVTYIVRMDKTIEETVACVNSIIKQTYPHIEIFLVGKKKTYHQIVNRLPENHLVIQFFPLRKIDKAGAESLRQNGSRWVGLLNGDHVLFENHTAMLVKYAATARKAGKKIDTVYGGTVEKSWGELLPELFQDDHKFARKDTIRLGPFSDLITHQQPCFPENALLCDVASLPSALRLSHINSVTLFRHLQKEHCLFVPEITSQRRVILAQEKRTTLQSAFQWVKSVVLYIPRNLANMRLITLRTPK